MRTRSATKTPQQRKITPQEVPHQANYQEQKENAMFLEKGHISFFYRPKVELEHASSTEEMQRFYVLLEPLKILESENSLSRLIVIAKKHMPDLERHEKVTLSNGDAGKLLEYLDSEEYDTVTRAHRRIEQARPCGHGVYGIVKKEKRTFLAYVLEFPEIPAQVQMSLNINKEGSYLLIIKNPEPVSDPETAGRMWRGLSVSTRARYEEDLQKSFKGRRFIPAIPVSYLNHEGCEMLLIGMTEKLAEKLESVGKDLEELELHDEVKHSLLTDEAVFHELHLDKTKFKSEALLGHWA